MSHFYIEFVGGPVDGESRTYPQVVRELVCAMPANYPFPQYADATEHPIAEIQLIEHLYRDSGRYSQRGRHLFTYQGWRASA